MRRRTAWLWVAASLLAPAAPAHAWHARGHERATRRAVAALPDDVPAFFRAAGNGIAQYANDPDSFTRPIGPDDLHKTESPEHYFDVERLGGKPMPTERYELLRFCFRNELHPSQVGLLPYAVTEWTRRLTVAFAEHRRWPDDKHIRRKALVYAGLLAHYAQDLCQPLHTTVHFDGRLNDDGASPRTGIHLKVDALLGKLPEASAATRPAGDAEAIKPFDKLFPAVVAELMDSHKRVDAVYALEAKLPALEDPLPGGRVAEFVKERMAASSRFTARLYLTAWRDSAKIELPAWHVHAQDDPKPADK